MSRRNSLRDLGGALGARGIGVASAVIAGVLAFLGLLFLLEAWCVHIVLDGLHRTVSTSVPAVSFSGACWIVVALSIIASFFKRTINRKDSR